MTLCRDSEHLGEAPDLQRAEDDHARHRDEDEETLHGVCPDHRLQPSLEQINQYFQSKIWHMIYLLKICGSLKSTKEIV